MSQSVVPDELWEIIELLPRRAATAEGNSLSSRTAPSSPASSSSFARLTLAPDAQSTRLRQKLDLLTPAPEWQQASVGEQLPTRLLNCLGDDAAIDSSRAQRR